MNKNFKRRLCLVRGSSDDLIAQPDRSQAPLFLDPTSTSLRCTSVSRRIGSELDSLSLVSSTRSVSFAVPLSGRVPLRSGQRKAISTTGTSIDIMTEPINFAYTALRTFPQMLSRSMPNFSALSTVSGATRARVRVSESRWASRACRLRSASLVISPRLH